MEFLEFKKELEYIFEKNSLSELLTEERAQKLYDLTQIMLEVNKSMNLTAITDKKAIILKHYADSLTVSKYIPNGVHVIDVGCGAGFPSLPLAIARPDLKITALDSTEKRIRYVTETAEMLGLTNVDAVAARAEEYANRTDKREKYDYATARAVASLPILCELTIPFIKVGGTLVAMKAKGANDEFEMSRSAIRQLAGAESLANTILIEKTLSGSINGEIVTENRTVVVMNKLASTHKRFPRKFAQIKKNPL